MPDDRPDRDREPDRPQRRDPVLPSPAERHISRSRLDETGMGKPLSQSSLERPRTVESYLRSGFLPRYMERLRQIHTDTERHREELAAAREELRAEHGDHTPAFAEAWRDRVASWDFDEVNELIRQHNEWYPVERQLPIDPRTRDYVLIAGRPYRRDELTPEWALQQFPPPRGG
jgi:hypothetical protein